jgi:hypothetical protein
MNSTAADVVATFFLLCVVGLLVKPGSTASTAVSGFTTALTTLIGTVTNSSNSTGQTGGGL